MDVDSSNSTEASKVPSGPSIKGSDSTVVPIDDEMTNAGDDNNHSASSPTNPPVNDLIEYDNDTDWSRSAVKINEYPIQTPNFYNLPIVRRAAFQRVLRGAVIWLTPRSNQPCLPKGRKRPELDSCQR